MGSYFNSFYLRRTTTERLWQDIKLFREGVKWFLCYNSTPKIDKTTEEQFSHRSEPNILELFATISPVMFDRKTINDLSEGQSQLCSLLYLS